MPNITPQDFGVLARSYTFEVKDGKLIVGNDQFYAAAIRRFGASHDLERIIVEEAETIIRDPSFSRTVYERACRRV